MSGCCEGTILGDDADLCRIANLGKELLAVVPGQSKGTHVGDTELAMASRMVGGRAGRNSPPVELILQRFPDALVPIHVAASNESQAKSASLHRRSPCARYPGTVYHEERHLSTRFSQAKYGDRCHRARETQ